VKTEAKQLLNAAVIWRQSTWTFLSSSNERMDGFARDRFLTSIE